MSSVQPPEKGSPSNPFLYDGTMSEIERFLMLGLMVAGKKAETQRKKLHILWNYMCYVDKDDSYARAEHEGEVTVDTYLPFESLHERYKYEIDSDTFEEDTCTTKFDRYIYGALQYASTGQYKRMWQALRFLAQIPNTGKWLQRKALSREDLMMIPGVGMKTASFFLMYTRRFSEVACLDTHILNFMWNHDLTDNVPKATPSSNLDEYKRLEEVFLDYCDDLDKPPGVVDFALWQLGSSDPIFYHDPATNPEYEEGWYHWDPELTKVYGPYQSKKIAKHELEKLVYGFLGILL